MPTVLDFAEVFKNHVLISVGDVAVSFISVDDLRTNKLATSRLQDLADAEFLEKK